MKYNSFRAACGILAVLLLSGCQSAGESVSVVDFGSSGGVDYSDGVKHNSADSSSQEGYAPDAAQSNSVQTSNSQPQHSEVLAQEHSHTEEPHSTETDKPEKSEQSSVESSTQTTKAVEVSTSAPKVENIPPQTTTTTTSQTIPQTAEPEKQPDYDFGSSHYTALNYSEVKGVWISYIELAELLTGQTRESFRNNIGEVFDNCVELGINTVYVHVRSHGDAYYRSELFPWSKYVTGTFGADPGFDPLDLMLTEAHSRGLSFHAWINPLRTCSTAQMSSYGSYPVYSFATGTGTAGKYAVEVGGTYYLNPAYDEVTQLIAAGAAEIVSSYDVDGLHIDDYFYPTTEAYFDSSAYSDSGCGSLSEFRLRNCDRMVSEIYAAVKSANPTALFSVSVQGSISNNYDQMYADVRKWCTQSGFLDVIIPQIYYGFENSAAPYQATLDEWDSLASAGGIPLVTGLSVSKVGCEDRWAGSGKNEWINYHDIISRQTAAAKKCGSYGGIALYSYRSIFQPEAAVSAAVSEEISALKELI